MSKILILHHAPNIGGGSLSFLDIITMLKDKHEVVACCPGFNSDLTDYLIFKGEKPLTLDLPIPVYNHYSGGHSFITRTFWKGISNIKYHNKWVEFFLKHKADIVIVNSSVMVLLGPAIKEAGAKAICFVRETFVEGNFNPRTKLMKIMLNKYFDCVCFISEYDKESANLKNVVTKKIADCVRPNYLTIIEKEEACEKLNVSPLTFNILFTGGSSSIKGLDIALNSLKKINNKNYKLIVAGNISIEPMNNKSIWGFIRSQTINRNLYTYNKKLRKLLDDKDISSMVEIVGSQKDMSYCYSACDVVIFPSTLPHQSRPLYEAGFYSKPVIISDFKQTKEYVENEKNGLFFQSNNAFSLANCLKKLYNNPNLRSSLGKENNILYKEKHDYNIEKEKLINVVSYFSKENNRKL